MRLRGDRRLAQMVADLVVPAVDQNHSRPRGQTGPGAEQTPMDRPVWCLVRRHRRWKGEVGPVAEDKFRRRNLGREEVRAIQKRPRFAGSRRTWARLGVHQIRERERESVGGLGEEFVHNTVRFKRRWAP